MADDISRVLSDHYDDEARANYAAANRQPTRLRPDEAYRGALLPFRQTTDGRTEWATPGLLQDVVDVAKEVGKAPVVGPGLPVSQMGAAQRDQFMGHLMAGALTPATGNLARMAINPAAGRNELGIFGGRGAKTADHGALERAQKMAAEGVDRDQIWKDTGWGKFPDDQWRFEISDHRAKVNPYPYTPHEAYIELMYKNDRSPTLGRSALIRSIEPYAGRETSDLLAEWTSRGNDIVKAAQAGDMAAVHKLQGERAGLDAMIQLMGNRTTGAMKRFLDHPDLYAAYPDWGDMMLRVGTPDPVKEMGTAGVYYAPNFTRGGGPENIWLDKLKDYDPQTKSTLLHELAHKGQRDEGFATGTNPAAAAGDIADAKLLADGLMVKSRQMQDAHSDQARYIMAEAARGNTEQQAFIDQATRKWQERLGVKSETNPYGVDAAQAVQFELSEGDDILNRVLRRYNRALDVSRQSPVDRYRSYAGEVEARTVQRRMKMLPRHRQDRPPWYDFDVPEDKQFVYMGGARGPVVPHNAPARAASRGTYPATLSDDSRARAILDEYTNPKD